MKSTRRDSATGVGCVLLLLILISPMWLVLLAGLFTPVLVAGLIVLTIVGGVASLFRK